jgi:hypothetical protein
MRRRTGDPGKGLIVGDPVKVAIDKHELILLNPDGKEMKMKITKRARAQYGRRQENNWSEPSLRVDLLPFLKTSQCIFVN